MSDFAFLITGDASKAEASINSLLGKLDKVESEAQSAGVVMTRAFEDVRRSIERSRTVHEQLTRQAQPLAQGFAKVAEAMQREQAVLERIHGPAQRYAQDLQALDSLLARNVINTKEYAAEVTRLNRAIDGTPKPTGQTPVSSGGAAASMLGGLRTGAAALGIGFSVSELGGMANEFQNLQNRLRFLAGGDMQKVNDLFAQLQGVANRTRSELGLTTEGFVKISMATKQMGLSQSQTMAFTERLNKAIQLSGATTSGAQAAMLQLSQGLSAGALRGEEFNSVLENAPLVIQTIAAQLGVTTGQLRMMAFDGKVTADVIVDAFTKAGASLDADFGNMVPTIAQSWTVFKNELIVTVGELDKSLGITQKLGSLMNVLMEAVKAVAGTIGLLGDGLSALSDIGVDFGAGTIIGFIAGGPLGAAVGTAIETIGDAVGAWDTLGTATLDYVKNAERAAELQNQLNAAIETGGSTLRNATNDLIAFNLEMALGAQAATAFKEATQAASRMSPAEFRKLFMQGDDIHQFGGMTGGGFAPKDAMGEWDAYVAKNGKAFDAVAQGAADMAIEREKAVTAAKKELASLELLWDSYNHGNLTHDLYIQKKKQLEAVINGTVAALHKEKKAHFDLLADIRARMAAEESAKRMRGVDTIRGAERESFLNLLGMSQGDAAIDAEFKRIGDRGLAAQAENEEAWLAAAKKAEEDEQARQKRLSEVHDAMTKSWMERIKEREEANQRFAASFSPIGDAIRDVFMQGEIAAESFDQTMRQVSFNLFKFMALQAAASLSGSGAGFAGALLGGIFGGTPGMATGGVVYAGNGGTDSQLVAFRKSPSEHMTTFVETQTQYNQRMMGGGGGGPPPVSLAVLTKNDEHEITSAFMGSAGETAVAVVSRKWRKRNR